ncbi:MAG: ATP-dependent helicase, partial [Anaerolineae bacterium]|nr:ATP-dependent helicase [Anaerolineae bacterium]
MLSPTAIDTRTTLEDLWQLAGFKPNPNQRDAILHTEGPLYLPAGPGSGKTRVLLWRTLNLIVFHHVKPDAIFLATFTEKAALQLQEGLRALLSLVTNRTGIPYDISRMYIGTVHSLCRRLLADRAFSADHGRPRIPVLLDAVDQYFFISRRATWETLIAAAGFDPESCSQEINSFFRGSSMSRYLAIQNCIGLFNRFSEECIDPTSIRTRTDDPMLQALIDLYAAYLDQLQSQPVPHTDLSLVQQLAYHRLADTPNTGSVFKHVIVDEYQDTNTIQERLYFKLAEGHKNLCVVGDDDQALYRFRGATVENFVQFPQRCRQHFGCDPRAIPLATNYRSRKQIVDFYTNFIDRCDWHSPDGTAEYRVSAKKIHAHSQDNGPAVVVTNPGKPDVIFGEIADLVRDLIDNGTVTDPNQIAFLFPSMKFRGEMTSQVRRMKEALEAKGFKIYAPRAGRFLDIEEAVHIFGLFFTILGKPERNADYNFGDYRAFFDWVDNTCEAAKPLIEADPLLKLFVKERQTDIKEAIADFKTLTEAVEANGWEQSDAYDIDTMKRLLTQTAGLSDRAKQLLTNRYFDRVVERRREEGDTPITLKYVITRATSFNWSALDLFYQLCGFKPFTTMFDLAQAGVDEGPVCNLSLISQQLARFVDEHVSLITAQQIDSQLFMGIFATRYLYALYRMGESEYEDEEDAFPKGRIPFLTIHQSKGLEFPVVVLPNLRKDNRGPQFIETVVRPCLNREGEPLERVAEFDIMRQFYVALSRAQNLLVLGHLKGQGNWVNQPFKQIFEAGVHRIADLDLSTVPVTQVDHKD